MIKLAEPFIGSEELQEIKKVIDSGYLVQGKEVERFEGMIAKYLNVKNCIAVSSGTAALHLSLLSLGIGNGDEVIVPDFTFPATVNAVEIVGAKPKFVDIDLNSFCIDTDRIEECITNKTKAIIPVHEFGQSADMDKTMKLAHKYNLKVIEDAACALGAEYNGKKVGSIGTLGCFSFHPRKAITTGEGGMIATNDDYLSEKIKAFRNHGISYQNGKLEFVSAGFNYRMTDIQGAIGVIQFKKLKNIISNRKIIANKYESLLKDEDKVICPLQQSYGKHIYQTYHILLKDNMNRDLVRQDMAKKGIETNIGAYAVHKQKYYREKYKVDDGKFINSLNAYENGLALPLHNKLSEIQIEYIIRSLKDAIKC